MKTGEQITLCVTVLCFMSLVASGETNATETTTNVVTHLRQINRQEGRYFFHVWRILEATNGVPELIAQSVSSEREVAALASNLLWRLAEPSWEKNRSPTNDWSKWWRETGSKKPFKELWHNFDSHHK
jgi:hypothetical protein